MSSIFTQTVAFFMGMIIISSNNLFDALCLEMDNMYVCLCHGVTDHAIVACLQQAQCPDFFQLQQQLGVATQCGRCAETVRALIVEHTPALPHTLPPEQVLTLI